MRCFNKECNSLSAQAVNVSLNISYTYTDSLDEYTGHTDYGDPSETIATSCFGDPDSCERTTYAPNWRDLVLKVVAPSGDDIAGVTWHF